LQVTLLDAMESLAMKLAVGLAAVLGGGLAAVLSAALGGRPAAVLAAVLGGRLGAELAGWKTCCSIGWKTPFL